MKRIMLVLLGVVALVALVGGAAFVGGRMLGGQSQPSAPAQGGQIRLQAGGDGKQVMYSLDIERAAELPSTPPLYKGGIFVRRADNSIFLGTGAVKMEYAKKADGTVSMSSSYDGPVVEIVVTHDTVVYRDVTNKQFNGQPSGDQKLQQVLEPGSIDEIGENSNVQVWGDKSGDRAVASVLVYSLPALLNLKPGAGR